GELDAAAAAVLQEQAESTRGADAWNRGRRQGKYARLRDLRELRVHLAQNGLGSQLGLVALAPGLKAHKARAHVACGRAGKETVARHRVVGTDAFGVAQDLFDFLEHGLGALKRRGVGKLNADDGVAVVFLGNEPRGQFSADDQR